MPTFRLNSTVLMTNFDKYSKTCFDYAAKYGGECEKDFNRLKSCFYQHYLDGNIKTKNVGKLLSDLNKSNRIRMIVEEVNSTNIELIFVVFTGGYNGEHYVLNLPTFESDKFITDILIQAFIQRIMNRPVILHKVTKNYV